MTTVLTRLRPLLAAGLTAVVVASGAVAASAEESPLVLDHGHVDAFAVFYEDNQLSLELKEDVTGSHVRHTPEDVLLHVKSDALFTLPDPLSQDLSFLGEPGDEVYYLSQTQDQNLVWPGWSTEGVPVGTFTGKINIDIANVTGPGDVFVWQTGSFGEVLPVLASGGTQLPGVIPTNVNAHVHANWVFTEPGTYELTTSASGTLSAGGTATTGTQTYTIQVGELNTDPEPVTTLSVSGGDGHFHAGDQVTLTAAQDPATDLDHYHWFTRTSPDAEWTIVPDVAGSEYSFTVVPEHEGLEVIARLYDDNHEVVAESDPLALDIHIDHEEEPSFSDVPESLTFHDEIVWLAGTGITTGYDDGTFRPSQPVLREQMAAFLYRLETLLTGSEPAVELPADGSPFTDVAETHAFYKEIVWLASTGITTGYTEADGSVTFRPSQPVLREQMAAFLYRFDESDAVDTDGSSFTDVAPSHVFLDEIEWLAGTGITTGYTEADGSVTFRPSQPVLREQMAAFLYRYASPE